MRQRGAGGWQFALGLLERDVGGGEVLVGVVEQLPELLDLRVDLALLLAGVGSRGGGLGRRERQRARTQQGHTGGACPPVSSGPRLSTSSSHEQH